MVVGGGASGAAVAIHLLGRGDAELHVDVLERGARLGRGIAYGVDDHVFRLNVPASRMSLDPRRPDDFVRWARAADPDAFLSRATYGQYVAARFAEAAGASAAEVRVVRGEAVAVDARSVHLSEGSEQPADIVVLATGIAPRVAPSSLPHDARIVDAWDERGLSAIPRRGRVLVLGAGLSALDIVALLESRGFTGSVIILSRRGLLPRTHLSPKRAPVPLAALEIDVVPTDLRGIIRWVRGVVRAYDEAGHPWQLAIDALRPQVTGLYRSLTPDDRARFVRSVRPYWDVLRHRAPADALALVDALERRGCLELLAGRVVRCEPRAAHLDVHLALSGGAPRSERVDCIVRCIGPALEPSEAGTPLVRALVASGLAARDPAGLGIVTDEHGRVVDVSGMPSGRIFAIGAVRRASSWETTSIPDIAVHALALAERIIP